MMGYQEKLEKEQLILFRFVDIGTDLFAMAACLSKAEQMMEENPNDQSPQELTDIFCSNASVRINNAFKAIKETKRHVIQKVSDNLL